MKITRSHRHEITLTTNWIKMRSRVVRFMKLSPFSSKRKLKKLATFWKLASSWKLEKCWTISSAWETESGHNRRAFPRGRHRRVRRSKSSVSSGRKGFLCERIRVECGSHTQHTWKDFLRPLLLPERSIYLALYFRIISAVKHEN